MKRALGLTLALFAVGVAVSFAADVNIGTWKLNEAKSKIAAGAPKNTTVVYEAAGDDVKVTTEGTDSSGNPTHSEWTGKYDGKYYPVTGDANVDSRSVKKVNDHTLAASNKKGDTVVSTGRIVVAPDGKSRTLTMNGTNAAGKKFSSTAVYDKQ
jgi:hypothetical protein